MHYICNYALASTGIDLRSFHQYTLYIVYIDLSHYICNYVGWDRSVLVPELEFVFCQIADNALLVGTLPFLSTGPIIPVSVLLN
jgi:hypothetical protein